MESLPKEWQSIDRLVNNAGLVIGTDKEQEGSLDEWDIVIDTNIKALLAMTRLIVPGMVELSLLAAPRFFCTSENVLALAIWFASS